ncbi:MAG: hypothetical protein QMC37_02645 [Flavobacteriales bacterium]
MKLHPPSAVSISKAPHPLELRRAEGRGGDDGGQEDGAQEDGGEDGGDDGGQHASAQF